MGQEETLEKQRHIALKDETVSSKDVYSFTFLKANCIGRSDLQRTRFRIEKSEN